MYGTHSECDALCECNWLTWAYKHTQTIHNIYGLCGLRERFSNKLNENIKIGFEKGSHIFINEFHITRARFSFSQSQFLFQVFCLIFQCCTFSWFQYICERTPLFILCESFTQIVNIVIIFIHFFLYKNYFCAVCTRAYI